MLRRREREIVERAGVDDGVTGLHFLTASKPGAHGGFHAASVTLSAGEGPQRPGHEVGWGRSISNGDPSPSSVHILSWAGSCKSLGTLFATQ